MSTLEDYQPDRMRELLAPPGFSRGKRITELRSVGVIGGGTAGYLTALALKRVFPQLKVTVVASSKIPVIGVGEATTPLLPKMLHNFLGLDVVEFYEKVRPTWKLGIKFVWGKPGDYYFNYPFEPGDLIESLAYEGHINDHWLAFGRQLDRIAADQHNEHDIISSAEAAFRHTREWLAVGRANSRWVV